MIAKEKTDKGLITYFKQISQTDLLTPQQEIDLAARIKKGDKAARDLMISANLRLVVKIAQDYANYGLPMADLISEGNIGLIKAVERFDPAKGGKLSTYAAWWIKQCIKRALANQSRTIRLPVHMTDKIAKMRRISDSMGEELGREPTMDELSELTGIDTRKLNKLDEISRRPASLDAPISDDSRGTYSEIVADESVSVPDTSMSNKDLMNQLDELLSELNDRERTIINERFGLTGKRSKTLVEVGEKFGVTRERIRQLQNVALFKMRRALDRKEDPRFQRMRNLIDRACAANAVETDPKREAAVAT